MQVRVPAAMALAALPAVLCSCTISPGSMTVRGHEVVVINPGNNTEIQGVFPDVSAGTPVTVTNGSGHVVASAVLHLNRALSARDGALYDTDPENVSDFVAVYNFTVTVPAGLPRYGITIGSGHGTVWFKTAQMHKGPVLTLGSLDLVPPTYPIACRASHPSGPCAESAGGGSLFIGRG